MRLFSLDLIYRHTCLLYYFICVLIMSKWICSEHVVLPDMYTSHVLWNYRMHSIRNLNVAYIYCKTVITSLPMSQYQSCLRCYYNSPDITVLAICLHCYYNSPDIAVLAICLLLIQLPRHRSFSHMFALLLQLPRHRSFSHMFALLLQLPRHHSFSHMFALLLQLPRHCSFSHMFAVITTPQTSQL